MCYLLTMMWRGVFSWIDHVLSTDYDVAWCIQLDRSCVIY